MPEKVREIPRKPNILVIWGDDIGITNHSCDSNGVMGYRTPNIDRLAEEGMFTVQEIGTTCCFATQDNVWVTGPGGERWEVYTVLADAEVSGTAGDVGAQGTQW